MLRNITVALLAAAVAATPLTAGAQFAIKAGASFASTSESDFVPDVSNKTGFAFGVSYGLRMGGNAFALHIEALYVQKGGDLGTQGNLDIDELDIPLLLQWNTPIELLFLNIGPQLEFELSCTAADVDCVDTESMRWGGVVGAGVNLGKKFTGELRYNWTWTDISNDFSSKPRTILLLAGFKF